jgi:hypothetical protein
MDLLSLYKIAHLNRQGLHEVLAQMFKLYLHLTFFSQRKSHQHYVPLNIQVMYEADTFPLG